MQAKSNFVRDDFVPLIVFVPDNKLVLLDNILTAALHAPYSNVPTWLGHIHEDLQQHSGSDCAESKLSIFEPIISALLFLAQPRG